jgi:hypothetical protein
MIKKLCGAILAIIMATSVAPASYHYGHYKTGITGTEWEYIDWNKVSWWDKQVIGITYANCKKTIARMEKDLAYHKTHSNMQEIARAEAKLKGKRKYCAGNGRPYEEPFWNDVADNFYLLALMFFVGLGFLLYPIAKKLCYPRLWEQAKKNINKN